MILFFFQKDTVFSNQKNEAEKVNFLTANPFSFFHIITDLKNQESQNAYGILRFPGSRIKNKYPLILGVNGSKNWADHHLEYMDMYRKMGFATFEIQSFNSRNVNSTVGDQTGVTTAMMILDSYKALEVLGRDNRIDIDNVAITGWSLGGGVALFSAWEPLIASIGIKERFKAHLAFYPPCLVEMDLIEFSKAPIHILIGEKDDWVTASACEDLVRDLSYNSVDIGITVYANAHHGFDRRGLPVKEEKGYATGNCHFRMRSDGALLMNFLDIPMITPLRQKVALGWCANRGTTIGGNPEARIKSFDFARNFMIRHLSQDFLH
ncbi:MAG: dienelactone hydrolase family protein [Candidatus Neomarinimicrobiota bacterium]